MTNRADIVYTLLRSFADVDIYDCFMKNALRYAKKDSQCYKLLDSCHGKATRVLQPIEKPLKVRPVVNISNTIEQMNPKMANPEYRKYITNLFLASKFKQNTTEQMNPKMADPEYRKYITNLFLATKFKQ